MSENNSKISRSNSFKLPSRFWKRQALPKTLTIKSNKSSFRMSRARFFLLLASLVSDSWAGKRQIIHCLPVFAIDNLNWWQPSEKTRKYQNKFLAIVERREFLHPLRPFECDIIEEFLITSRAMRTDKKQWLCDLLLPLSQKHGFSGWMERKEI